MTATYAGPTPYDAEIERCRKAAEHQKHHWSAVQLSKEDLALKDALFAATVYRRAKTEDAPLLEAVEDALSVIAGPVEYRVSRERQLPAIIEKITSAIAAATGKE